MAFVGIRNRVSRDLARNMPTTLDAIDRRILAALQRDSRISNLQLAEAVGLSASPCLRRVKILEENGVIDRYVALVNQAAVNLKMTMFVRVTMARNDQATMDNFAAEVRAMREVVECHLLSGGCDFLLRVVAEDIEDYQRFQSQHLTKISGILNVETQISLKQISRTTELPL